MKVFKTLTKGPVSGYHRKKCNKMKVKQNSFPHENVTKKQQNLSAFKLDTTEHPEINNIKYVQPFSGSMNTETH